MNHQYERLLFVTKNVGAINRQWKLTLNLFQLFTNLEFHSYVEFSRTFKTYFIFSSIWWENFQLPPFRNFNLAAENWEKSKNWTLERFLNQRWLHEKFDLVGLALFQKVARRRFWLKVKKRDVTAWKTEREKRNEKTKILRLIELGYGACLAQASSRRLRFSRSVRIDSARRFRIGLTWKDIGEDCWMF